MPGDKCILQLRGLRPFFSPKYNLRKHPNYKYTAEADKRNAFDSITLTSTKLTVKPEDTFKVYAANSTKEDKGGDGNILNFDDMDDPDGYA